MTSSIDRSRGFEVECRLPLDATVSIRHQNFLLVIRQESESLNKDLEQSLEEPFEMTQSTEPDKQTLQSTNES